MIGRQPRPPRVPVLVLASGDGYVEAFAAERQADIHFARLPWTGAVPDGEAALEYTLATLPPRFRGLYRADCMVSNATLAPVLPSRIARAQQELAMLSSLDAMAAALRTSCRDEVVEWT